MVAVVLAVFSEGSSLVLTVPTKALPQVVELNDLINQSVQVERWSADGLIIRSKLAGEANLEQIQKITLLLGQLGWLVTDPMEDPDFELTVAEHEILEELYPTMGLHNCRYYKSNPQSLLQVSGSRTIDGSVSVGSDSQAIETVQVLDFDMIEGGEAIQGTLAAEYHNDTDYVASTVAVASLPQVMV